MATVPSSSSAPPVQPITRTETTPTELSPSQTLSERLRGTVTIYGDIVNRDPELWDCERG